MPARTFAPFLLVAMSAAAACAGVQTVSDRVEFLDPDFGTTFNADFLLDRFDTQQGTRTLTSVDLVWTIKVGFSGSHIANHTADTIGTQIEWETSWTGGLGATPLPYELDLENEHKLWHGFGFGEDSEPGDPAGAFDFSAEDGFVIIRPETGITDAALLAALTGAGQAVVDGSLDISPSLEVPYGGIFHDIFFPDVVFVPGYLSLNLDSYSIDLDATYHFVPAPAAPATALLASLAFSRRRRR